MSTDVPPQRKIARRVLPILFGLVAAAFVAWQGCEQGAFNKTHVFALKPEQEDQLGAQAFQQVLRESTVVPGGPLVERLQEVGRRLADASQDPKFLQAAGLQPRKFAWEFRLVQSKQINAFCLPGGKVVFYTGIMPVCETDGGMATVMGHEIGHALARHGSQRMAQKKIVGILQTSAAVSLSDMDPDQQRQVLAMLGMGAQFGILLPYSRDHESEADHLGVLMMAVAGYDPKYSVAFWQRMSKATGGGKTPEFQSTHPSHETRVRSLEDWQEEALRLYRTSQQQQSSRPLPHR